MFYIYYLLNFYKNNNNIKTLTNLRNKINIIIQLYIAKLYIKV